MTIKKIKNTTWLILIINMILLDTSWAAKPILTYQCEAGKNFKAQFLDSSVRLQIELSKTIMLPQVTAASGARYSDGKITLYTKGQEAFIDIEGKRVFNNCTTATKPRT
jgi:membrane-bound inhibitor of C-type lysozyme